MSEQNEKAWTDIVECARDTRCSSINVGSEVRRAAILWAEAELAEYRRTEPMKVAELVQLRVEKADLKRQVQDEAEEAERLRCVVNEYKEQMEGVRQNDQAEGRRG